MFIVWGKKAVYRKLGYAADFCSICRGPRIFSIRRVGMAGHVYYVSVGEGELVGFDRTCQECNTPYPADPSTYKSLEKKPTSLNSLIRETFPNLAEVWADRIALEQRVKQAASLLSREERTALIREPFLRLSPKVEARFSSTHLDKEVGFAAVGAIALLILLPPLVRAAAPDQEGPAFLTSLVLGFLLVAWQIAVSGRRYLRREILPTLGIALQPLRPSDLEIGAALSELKKLGHKIGAKLRPVDVSNHLQLAKKPTNGALTREG
jgi:hypothetical protein